MRSFYVYFNHPWSFCWQVSFLNSSTFYSSSFMIIQYATSMWWLEKFPVPLNIFLSYSFSLNIFLTKSGSFSDLALEISLSKLYLAISFFWTNMFSAIRSYFTHIHWYCHSAPETPYNVLRHLLLLHLDSLNPKTPKTIQHSPSSSWNLFLHPPFSSPRT